MTVFLLQISTSQKKTPETMTDDLKISSLLAQRKKVPLKNQSTTKAEDLVMSIFDRNKIQKTWVFKKTVKLEFFMTRDSFIFALKIEKRFAVIKMSNYWSLRETDTNYQLNVCFYRQSWTKFLEQGQIGQEQITLTSTFAWVLTVTANTLFPKGRLGTSLNLIFLFCKS